MTMEDIKAALRDMTAKERNEIRKYAFQIDEDLEPTISLKMGQVVEWVPDDYSQTGRKLIGFSADNQKDTKLAYIIEYMKDYDTLRLTRAPASKVTIRKERIDLSAVTGKEEPPRVMRLDEIWCDRVYWLEWVDVQSPEPIAMKYSVDDFYVDYRGDDDVYDIKNYGIQWRLWSKLPTDDDMAAVPWEDADDDN